LRTVKKVVVPGLNYKSLQHDDVNAAVLEVEEMYHIVSWVLPLEKSSWSKTTVLVKGQPRETFLVEIGGVKRYQAIESPRDAHDYIDAGFYFLGLDYDDKGSGKAISMASKYADAKTYRLATGDNEEARLTSPADARGSYKKTGDDDL
jgi:hypothetical protein